MLYILYYNLNDKTLFKRFVFIVTIKCKTRNSKYLVIIKSIMLKLLAFIKYDKISIATRKHIDGFLCIYIKRSTVIGCIPQFLMTEESTNIGKFRRFSFSSYMLFFFFV